MKVGQCLEITQKVQCIRILLTEQILYPGLMVEENCMSQQHMIVVLGSYKEYFYISLSFANYGYLLNYENWP